MMQTPPYSESVLPQEELRKQLEDHRARPKPTAALVLVGINFLLQYPTNITPFILPYLSILISHNS